MAKGRITGPKGDDCEKGQRRPSGCGFTQDGRMAAIWTSACDRRICGGAGGIVKELIARRL